MLWQYIQLIKDVCLSVRCFSFKLLHIFWWNLTGRFFCTYRPSAVEYHCFANWLLVVTCSFLILILCCRLFFRLWLFQYGYRYQSKCSRDRKVRLMQWEGNWWCCFLNTFISVCIQFFEWVYFLVYLFNYLINLLLIVYPLELGGFSLSDNRLRLLEW